MSHFSEMDWSTKWDWENIVSFGPKKPPIADWMLVDETEINHGPFNLSRSDNSSSISASTDSSTKDFRLSQPLEASSEPLIGLGLGKRTYFENTIKGPSSYATPKKNKPGPVCCQVEGCNTDLSKAKEYHRKHRVCDVHSKCPKVIVTGVERRFCQQCSRFHSLCEFDEKKRSCRRRLSDHNARRRKPQQDTIHFNSTTPFYVPDITHSRAPASSIWDNNSKFTLTKTYPSSNSNGLFPTKNLTSDVFNPGSKGGSQLLGPPDRALSLLSSNTWNSCEPEQHIPFMTTTQSMIPEGVPLSDFWPSASVGGYQQSIHHQPYNVQSNNNIGNFQEFQRFKTPYEAEFYSNILN